MDLKARQSPAPSYRAAERSDGAPAVSEASVEASAGSDHELAALAAAGDRDAFERLLRRHYERIHRLAWRLMGSVADAEDVAQDVCCKLVEKIDTFKGEAQFTTWLTGIVVNTCRDRHRRGSAIMRLTQHLGMAALLSPAPDGRDLHARAWLASALARLDPALRATIVLVAGEDMSHAEAANALGVAESTVSWRMRQARRLLAAEPEEEADHGH